MPAKTRALLPWYFPVIEAWDWFYCRQNRLHVPESVVDSILCVQVARTPRPVELESGRRIARGEPVGFLHLRNEFVYALHDGAKSPCVVGLGIRRRVPSSLACLADQARDGNRFSHLRAFGTTTLFYKALLRLGFEKQTSRIHCARLVGTMLDTFRPWDEAGSRRFAPAAKSLWMTREDLLARFGAHNANDPLS